MSKKLRYDIVKGVPLMSGMPKEFPRPSNQALHVTVSHAQVSFGQVYHETIDKLKEPPEEAATRAGYREEVAEQIAMMVNGMVDVGLVPTVEEAAQRVLNAIGPPTASSKHNGTIKINGGIII